MALHGVTIYGTDTYGYDIPPAFRVDPFVATSINYSNVLVTWTPPAGNILAYRLVKNRWGFPVDQDDGELLIDSLNYPGNQFTDTNVTPGTYQYYGFYVLLNFLGDQWVRSGLTACLATNNYESSQTINSLIPTFYTNQTEALTDVLSPDFPQTVLDFFCEVLGWGVDYLKTQYDTYLNVNNPWKISLSDLYNLGTQLGININPDIHPYTLRKAIYYNAPVTKQRGTVPGIEQELDVLTGWAADLRVSQNMMLSNDQSAFLDPVFLPWSQYLAYNIGEYVGFGNYWYQCIATGNIGNAPSGTNTSNTWWTPITNVDSTAFINNSVTGLLNTWELLNPNASNGAPAASSFFEELGIANPLNTVSFQYNGIKGYNKTGSTGTIWLRSSARVPADVQPGAGSQAFAPNKDQTVGSGIPVPFVTPSLEWNGTSWASNVEYGVNNIVTYSNQPFISLRGSTNIVPPYATRGGINSEWAPLGFDTRLRLCLSAYITGSSSANVATPFVEWFDANGNFITRVIARNAGTNPSLPAGLVYDSFTSGANTVISGRTTDDGSVSWTQATGTFDISPYYEGSAYPASATTRTYATVNSGVANCQVGVTFVTAPSSSTSTGIVLRWQDDNNYLFANQSTLWLKQNSNFTALGAYSIPANVGDRLIVQLNGSTITILVNNSQVLQVTSSFNNSGTIHGIMNEIIGTGGGGGGTVTVTNPGSQTNVVNQAI